MSDHLCRRLLQDNMKLIGIARVGLRPWTAPAAAESGYRPGRVLHDT